MARIIVTHGGYGCDTGCCGHYVAVDGAEARHFKFVHPYGRTDREFIEAIVREACGAAAVADIDWDACLVVNDC